MAVLEIKKYPDSVLKKKCENVKEITPEIKKLIEGMMETMVKSKPEGIGLSAPQVGYSKRIITIQTEKDSVVFINPKILKKAKEQEVMEEGCLSFPGIWLKIKRAKAVEVEAVDKNGKRVQIETRGLLARVLQHEIDHLDGILFIDRVSPIQRLKVRKQLQKIKVL